MAIVSDLLQLCRLCLVKDEVNVPIFEGESDDQQISLKISSCLPVTLSQDDRLPQKICSECCRKLDTLYEFRNSSVNAEKQLVTWLEELENQSKKTSEKMSIATESLSEKTIVKEEIDEVDENGALSNEAEDYILQQQVAYDKTDLLNDAADETGEPQPKRAKRAAALKALIHTQESEEDEEDIDEPEPITKAEEESEPSETDINESVDDTFAGGPSTSADDQPGPSGVGKSTEGPSFASTSILERQAALCTCVENPINYGHAANVERLNFSESSLKLLNREKRSSSRLQRCNKCGEFSRYRHNLKITSTHHDSKQFICNFCDSGMIISANFNRSRKWRKIAVDDLVCKLCDEKFHSTIKFHKHAKKCHENEGISYKCGGCGNVFKNNKLLQKHQETNDKKSIRHACYVCGKVLMCAKSLEIHLSLIHKVHKHIWVDLTCSRCGKVVKILDEYMGTRVEGKSFHCNSCKLNRKKQFKTIPLKYKCKYCDQSFSQKFSHLTHLRYKHNDLRYECRLCSDKFTSFIALQQHFKKHGIIMTDSGDELPTECKIEPKEEIE